MVRLLLRLMLLGSPLVGAVPAVAQESPIALRNVTRTAEGTYLAGSPNAPVRLVEYVSYTCPYCAIYEDVGASGRAARYIKSGKLSIEVHNVVLDPVDLATALLVRCGPAESFFERHHAFMRRQPVTLSAITPELEQAWQPGSVEARMVRIATDTGLLQFVITLGIDSDRANRCLTDQKEISLLDKLTDAERRNGLEGSPSFVINGKVLSDIHTWAGVRAKLDQSLAANAGS